jgi:hypothetical protein
MRSFVRHWVTVFGNGDNMVYRNGKLHSEGVRVGFLDVFRLHGSLGVYASG